MESKLREGQLFEYGGVIIAYGLYKVVILVYLMYIGFWPHHLMNRIEYNVEEDDLKKEEAQEK